MEIVFKGRQTDVPERFREHATGKLNKIEKLDAKAIRVDVEVLVERNPRQASQKERVELTIRSRGPAIRAEAAAEDRFAALDLALAKLDSRLRRALDRRKSRHVGHGSDRREAEPLLPADVAIPAQVTGPPPDEEAAKPTTTGATAPHTDAGTAGGSDADASGTARASASSVVSIEMEGNGPLVVRQKFHHADPISIDQALFEMELVGHDFYLFHDVEQNLPSVVYRRRGYQYGVIRLVENSTSGNVLGPVAMESGARQRAKRHSSSGAEASRPRSAGEPTISLQSL